MPPPPNLCKYLHIPPLSIRPLKLTNSNRPLDSISDKSFKKNRLHLTLCTRIYILFLKNIYLEMLLYRQKKMLKFAHLKNNKSRNFSRHSFSSLTIHKPWARSVQPFYANKLTSKVYIERDVCAVYCVKYIYRERCVCCVLCKCKVCLSPICFRLTHNRILIST